MRAHKPEVDLMLFDEPVRHAWGDDWNKGLYRLQTSALDAHAQANVFEEIERVARGDRKKTVIFITHRLATARRADKILMLDNGEVLEFGTHDELMDNDGPYAALYRASI
jgi:ABC-type multidrug transport system fused ATPase/permease subunit